MSMDTPRSPVSTLYISFILPFILPVSPSFASSFLPFWVFPFSDIVCHVFLHRGRRKHTPLGRGNTHPTGSWNTYHESTAVQHVVSRARARPFWIPDSFPWLRFLLLSRARSLTQTGELGGGRRKEKGGRTEEVTKRERMRRERIRREGLK